MGNDLREKIARHLAPVCFDPATYTGVGCNAALAEADAILALVRAHLTSDAAIRRMEKFSQDTDLLGDDYYYFAILAALDGEGGT